MGTPLQEFLDGLGVPVLVVDGEGAVQTANMQARGILGKDLPEIEGSPGGNVIECVNASSPEGCGNTIHCKACTIRQTVMDTFATGRGRSRLPAYPDIKTSSGPRRLRFQISTEKVRDVVLLRLDDIDDDD
jgi:nitrogen fixation/metabolism regulation signal transduction histidine kinase